MSLVVGLGLVWFLHVMWLDGDGVAGYLAAVIVIQLGVCGVLEEYDAETRASKCNTLVVEYRM